MPETNFEKLLLTAVDEALASLGESSKQAIYFYLDKNFQIEKEDIPQKIGAFVDALEEVFGVGADFLEVLIMKRLHESIGVKVEWNYQKEFTFAEYINVAKRNFHEKNSITLGATIVKCEEAETET